MITAAVDILGGIGADYVKSGRCNNGPPAAFLKLHGMKDPFITYDRQVSDQFEFRCSRGVLSLCLIVRLCALGNHPPRLY